MLQANLFDRYGGTAKPSAIALALTEFPLCVLLLTPSPRPPAAAIAACPRSRDNISAWPCGKDEDAGCGSPGRNVAGPHVHHSVALFSEFREWLRIPVLPLPPGDLLGTAAAAETTTLWRP